MISLTARQTSRAGAYVLHAGHSDPPSNREVLSDQRIKATAGITASCSFRSSSAGAFATSMLSRDLQEAQLLPLVGLFVHESLYVR